VTAWVSVVWILVFRGSLSWSMTGTGLVEIGGDDKKAGLRSGLRTIWMPPVLVVVAVEKSAVYA